MPTTYTENTFSSTYKDDYDESKNFQRILFNSGRALQARELTQLQTILQNQISSVTGNLFNEGAPITPGSFKVDNAVEFVKINPATPFPSDPTVLEGLRFANADDSIKFTIIDAIAAEDDDPDTLFVEYTEQGETSDTPTRLSAGDTITSDDGEYTFDIQTINTNTNPAVGVGSSIEVDQGQFFIQGHIVFCPAQKLIFRKYETNVSSAFGFVISQDIITSDDDETLYDNQGATPNRTSPGADRYRIRLTLADARNTTLDKNFIQVVEVEGGQLVNKVTSSTGFKSIRDEMAIRTHEESGDYIKRYFRASFAPNSSSNFKLKITPGTAYVKGYRINKDAETTILVDKPTETFSRNNDSITIDFGNYFLYTGGKKIPDFTTCEKLNLHDAVNGGGNVIGTTRVRALNKFGDFSGTKKIHVFDTVVTTEGKSIRDVRSVADTSSPTTDYLNTYRETGSSITKLYKTDKRPLLFDAPLRRPKEFTDISLTVAKLTTGQGSGANGSITITPGTDNALADTGQWIIASADTDDSDDVTFDFSASTTDIEGLAPNTNYDILYYEKISNASQKTKTLTTETVTTALDSDGEGVKFINLNKTDLYEVTRCTAYDSDGKNQLSLFGIDNGQRDTHYGLARLIYKGSGLDSDGQNVYVKFKHFAHPSSGDFFGVNSYDGQVDYVDIPVHRTASGQLVNLRDVLDFRPSVNTSENFSGSGARVLELPYPGDLVNADAKYYMPRLDKLVLSKGGELRYIQGVSSLQPKYPSTPVDCIDLYKIEMGANTLHTKDLKATIIPRRGYTMEDINKIDKRLEKLETATTLSLLEINANNERLYDSDGNERIHTGFFVDNFKNHKFTDTKSIEHRASMDPTKGLIRPPYTCKTIPMIYDSDHPVSSGVVRKGDNVYLAHEEVQWKHQLMASKTINVNPFHVEKSSGDLVLSPSKDTWKNFEQDAPLVVDGGTEFDTKQALLWNEAEWGWQGTDVNDLQIGMTTAPLVEQTSNTTLLGESTRQIGSEVTVDPGEWVVTGSQSNTTTLNTGTEILGVENNQVVGDTIRKTESNQTAYVGKRINRSTFLPSKYGHELHINVKDELVITAPAGGHPYIKRCKNHGETKLYTLANGQQDIPANWVYRGKSKISLNAGDKLMIKGHHSGTNHIYFGGGGGRRNRAKMYKMRVSNKRASTQRTANTYQEVSNERTTYSRDTAIATTVTNTSYQRTDTVSTENKYETTAEYNTATETTTTVNRIASESVLTEVVDNRELQVIHVPWMRSRKVSFKATNLRPNTRYFPFFNNTDVSNYCKPKTFYKSSTFTDPDYTDSDGVSMIPEVELPPARQHSEGSGDLISDANGILEGEFEVPNIVDPPMRFPSGTAVFSLYDISVPDPTKSLSFAKQFYTSSGVVESLSGEYTITNTRVLEIVGNQETSTTNDRYSTTTISTDTVVTEDIQTDVKTETTRTQVYGPTETNTAITDTKTVLVDRNVTYDYAQSEDPVGGVATLRGNANYSTGKSYLLPHGTAAGKKITVPKFKVFKDEDPAAQSFEVLDPNGIYLTRVRLFFAEKPESTDDQYSVSIAITEAPAGFPDRTRRVPGSFTSLKPSQVKTVPSETIASMVANGTDFVFDEPIFLQGNGANYAIIVRSKSMKYKMYISEVEDFLLGSTERRIMKQPTLGSLFVSQNTDVWEPRGQQDLAYVMYRADFENQGNVYLHNRKIRPVNLVKNPIMTDSGDNTVTVFSTGHGLRKGDRTRILGVDANTRYNGILGSSILGGSGSNNYRVVTSVDATSIQFEADSTATASGRVGGGTVRLLQNIPFETIRPDLDIVQPEGTNYTLSTKLTKNSSLGDSDNSNRMEVDTSFSLMKNKSNTTLDQDYAVMNAFEEASENSLIANDNHSLVSQITFKTSDTRVSPMLDLESTDFKLTSNIIDMTDTEIIDEYFDGGGDGEDEGARHIYFDEGTPREGTVAAKHMCIPITLAETAVGLRIMMSVNRPPETGFKLYWRCCTKDKNIYDFDWNAEDTLSDIPADNNKNTFREYSYLVGGQEGHLEPFDQFQLKITFASKNSAKVPVIKSLRAIALAD